MAQEARARDRLGGQPRDATVGLDATGEMCVYATHGALRLEHQFSGQKVLVPSRGRDRHLALTVVPLPGPLGSPPGAVVVLGDERVEVQPDGRFTHVVVLREGRQRLSARAHGVGGSAAAEGPAVVLDTRAPDARFDTRDLWAPPRK